MAFKITCSILISTANHRNRTANSNGQRKAVKTAGNMLSEQKGIKRRDLPVDYLKCLEFSLGL